MKTPQEQRKHLYVVIALVGGGGLILVVLANASGAHATTGAGAPARPTMVPNPANASLEASLLTAREAALNTYDQSAVAEKSIGAQYQLGIAQNAAQKAIAFNTNLTQLKETGMTTRTAEAIAAREVAAQELATRTAANVASQEVAAQQSIGSQYAQAQQTQASGGFWGSILGGIGSILPFLGL